jgi:hypothetical protein
LLNLDKNRYFHVNVKFINLYGDLFHTIKDGIRIRLERFAFTWSQNVKFYDAGRFEGIRFPLYYRRIIAPHIHIVHPATVKSAKYILYRQYWTDWREIRDFSRFPTLQDYVKYRLKHDFDIDSEEEGIKKICGEHFAKLVKCDYLLKDCPDVLRNELKRPRYKILYSDGKIVGRSDIGIIL